MEDAQCILIEMTKSSMTTSTAVTAAAENACWMPVLTDLRHGASASAAKRRGTGMSRRYRSRLPLVSVGPRRHMRRRSTHRQRTVHVRAYHRFRFGKWEVVRAHFRSPPGQLSFSF